MKELSEKLANQEKELVRLRSLERQHELLVQRVGRRSSASAPPWMVETPESSRLTPTSIGSGHLFSVWVTVAGANPSTR